MKGNRLVKVYDRLTPQERFVLALTADARGDKTERQELVRTCPKHAYRMTDAEFTHRVDTSRWLALAVMCDTQKLLGWLDLLTVLRPALAEEKQRDDSLAASVCMIGGYVAGARVKAVWEAFQDACSERLGIEARILLRAHGIPLEDRLAEHADHLATVERDETLYAEYRDTVEAVWARALGTDSAT